ncbi:MAG: cyclic nucleotide-binding domain-containing protein [Candidatus Porifericomitaceae bacterium WSBS_2022_MAG_OTU9]
MVNKEKLKAVLRRVQVFRQLAPAAIDKLAEKVKLFSVAENKVLFRKGAKDSSSYFLISGELILRKDGKNVVLKADTMAAANAVADHQPRNCDAITKSKCIVLTADRQELDLILTWNQVADIEVNNMEDDEERDNTAGDWMKHLLSCQAFAKIPPSNIQAMFMCMVEIKAEKGKVLFRQGDKGDYFYLIRHGECDVMRETGGKKVLLATLRAGATFGEESLLTDAPRNATVIMRSQCKLMRMSKSDFNSLLREPMLNWLSRKEADSMIDVGDAQWLDVRLDSEYKESGIAGSKHIPLFMLRLKAESLDPNAKYILYCNTGRRSSAGAYLLTERGMDVYCLKGGLNHDD